MNNPLDPTLRDLGSCGCCTGIGAATPQPIVNAPGLPAIRFRPGRHADFKRSLLAALSATAAPALGALQTREDDDFTIALLDGWASIAEILSFYSERVANESYLGTATERRSILELVRAIGTELRPGVASAADLSFTIEDAPGAPGFAHLKRRTQVQSLPGPDEKPQTFETIEPANLDDFVLARAEWNEMRALASQPFDPAKDTVLPLQGAALNLKPGDGLLFVRGTKTAFRFVADSRAVPAADPADAITLVTLDRSLASETALVAATEELEVLVFRQRVGLFGSNAPMAGLLAKTPGLAGLFEGAVGSEEWKHFSSHQVGNGGLRVVHLDAVYSSLALNSRFAIGEVQNNFAPTIGTIDQIGEAAPAQFAVSNRVTKLSSNIDLPDFPLRSTTVFLQAEKLTFARLPSGEILANKVLLDRAVDGLTPGQRLFAIGRVGSLTAPMVAEPVVVESLSNDGGTGFTILKLAADLQHKFLPATLSFIGNIVSSTHGESIPREVLGSGDASTANQRFTLRQAPLTFVPAANEAGCATTLEVSVNDLRWNEVPSFYAAGPADRVYVTRRDDAGRVTVIFGDGRHGARLPSGRENVIAAYRKGAGREGEVQAGQLSLLITRALGVRSVTNPLRSTPAVDPEAGDVGRRRAPRQVLTLGRVVSVKDYEDFARNFLGIAKAEAIWTWDTPTRGIFLTLVPDEPPSGSPALDPALVKRLQSALAKAGNDRIPLKWNTCRRLFFDVAGTVYTDPALSTNATVLTAVKARLDERFGFAARALGQPVALSEVIAAIQEVPGVVHTQLTSFGLHPVTANTLPEMLPASRALNGAAAKKLTDPAAPPTDLLTFAKNSFALTAAPAS